MHNLTKNISSETAVVQKEWFMAASRASLSLFQLIVQAFYIIYLKCTRDTLDHWEALELYWDRQYFET